MSKVLVETSGRFGLMDLNQGDAKDRQIYHNRPSVVQATTFVQARLSNGQLKFLGKVNNDATNEAFAAYMEECRDEEDGKVDFPLAVESFVSEFGVEEVAKEPAKEPAKKARKPRAPAKEATKEVAKEAVE